jgi:uncharacterized protein YejL (UPF0352 family)
MEDDTVETILNTVVTVLAKHTQDLQHQREAIKR